MSFEQYNEMCEAAHLASYVGRLESEIRQLSSACNRRCWPLYSFGGKDADLEPEGCCGIRRVVGCDLESITVEVGGHKTLSAPEDELERQRAYEFVCGTCWSAEWTGDEWTFSFSQHLTVPLPWDDSLSDDQNYAAMAQAIVDAAEAACEPFSHDMAALVSDINSLGDAAEPADDNEPEHPL